MGITLADDVLGEAVAKGTMPTAAEDDTAATDRDMEVGQLCREFFSHDGTHGSRLLSKPKWGGGKRFETMPYGAGKKV